MTDVPTIDLSQKFAEYVKFRVPTGIVAIDRVCGGGIPAGKLTEIYGGWSSGKSRLAAHIIAETQRLGGIGVLLDNERSLDAGLVNLTGIQLNETFFYPDPDTDLKTIEDVFGVMQNAVKTLRGDNPDRLLTVVWDSLAATPGAEDLDAELGMATGAMRRAKVISDGLKQIMSEVHKSKTCLVFINQIRDKIGVMYGEKTDTVGGKALKFAASLRLHMELNGKIKDEKTEELIGNKGRLVVDKNKVGRPFGVVNFEMYVDKPIDKYSGMLDYMVRHSEIEQTGGWYKFPGQQKKFRADDFAKNYEELFG